MLYAEYENDKEYLINKFRNPVFPADSGKNNAYFRENICTYADSFSGQPFPVVKARCFEYVCQNIQIDVSTHDYFPAFGCYDRLQRPLSPLLWKREALINSLYHQKSSQIIREQNYAGIQMAWKDYDHSVPDWNAILLLGFPGLRDRARKYRDERIKNGTLTDDAKAYFDGLEITISAVLDCLDRIISYAKSHYAGNPRIEEQIACLEHLKTGAPQNTYEVLQIIYLHFIFGEHIDAMQVRSLGNFDHMVEPYWRRDIQNGTYTEEKLRAFLTCFIMQWGSINNYWGQPVYFGGTQQEGSTYINSLSYTFLDVYDELDITTPKLQIKIAPNTPRDFISKALDMIRHGHSSIVFVSEKSIRDVMLGMGYSEEEARTCDIKGCYEFAPSGTQNETLSTHINMLKPFELILNDGADPATGYVLSCDAQKLADIHSFSDFYKAYIKYLNHIIDVCLECGIDQEKHIHEINPGNMFSLTIRHSLETAMDAFAHGCVYNISTILLVGLGTMTDAFMAVKEFVFERKEITLAQFRDILKSDWNGYEKLRLRILHSRRKYGNGLPDVDYYAKAIVHFCASKINLHPNGKYGFFSLSGHTAKQYFELGKRTGATPDGRKAGTEMSKNLSPTMGMDTNGVTSLVRSVTAINSQDLPADYPLDVMMHPATVQGEDGLDAMWSVVQTYFDRGGIAIHFNIFDQNVLEDAQRHPEKYEGLQVRVCGWNVRFNDMCKVEQDAYIERARNIAE